MVTRSELLIDQSIWLVGGPPKFSCDLSDMFDIVWSSNYHFCENKLSCCSEWRVEPVSQVKVYPGPSQWAAFHQPAGHTAGRN